MSAALQPAPSLVAIIDAAHAQSIKPAADRWVAALKQARADANDPDRAIADAIIALEDLAGAAADIAKTLRRELVAAMVNDGTVAFEIEHHTVSRREGSRLVQVTDSKALATAHPELMVPQPDEPDRKEIGRRLRNGEALTGCTLTNGGPATLTISAKKKG